MLHARLFALLACPGCKAALTDRRESLHCELCGVTFRQTSNGAWDFRPTYPRFLVPKSHQQWASAQENYERHSNVERHIDHKSFLLEVQTVAELYEVFDLSGRVLDVGGHSGTLRQFLSASDAYLSVDPWSGVFDGLAEETTLLEAYPVLREPCNFVAGMAERLPLRADSFDVVHMRSVLDHFEDPVLALQEAQRVLRADGRIVIGSSVTGGQSSLRKGRNRASLVSRIHRKWRNTGLTGMVKGIALRLKHTVPKDEHLWHPTYDELIALIQFAGMQVEKVCWQKPPMDQVVYLSARKTQRGQ